MKFIFLQILLFTFSYTLSAQKKILEREVSITIREEKLKDVLDIISRKTDIYFSYNSELISVNQRFTLKENNKSLYQILDKLLVGTSLHYKVVRKQIIIYKKVKDQLNPKIKISFFGTVRNAITKEPISDVNVFVSGTLKGSSTDKLGNFSIDDMSPDSYELVFSHVSYDIRFMPVNAKHNKPTSFSILLFPKTIQLQEVEIVAQKNKKTRERHFYIFESEFIGNTINAAKCRVTNPEVINFEYNKKQKILTASAEQPLLIENQALGYNIQYFLQSFENDHYKSLIHGVLSFSEKVSDSKRERKQWKKNRKKSYYGSYAHFLKAAYNYRIKREGFKLYLVDTVGGNEISEISGYNILSKNKKGLDVEMKFKGFLRIEYLNGEYLSTNEIIKEYYRIGNAIENGVQISYIKLNKPKVTILKNGLLKEQFAITKYGYWSWERVAEYLPFEYKP